MPEEERSDLSKGLSNIADRLAQQSAQSGQRAEESRERGQAQAQRASARAESLRSEATSGLDTRPTRRTRITVSSRGNGGRSNGR